VFITSGGVLSSYNNNVFLEYCWVTDFFEKKFSNIYKKNNTLLKFRGLKQSFLSSLAFLVKLLLRGWRRWCNLVAYGTVDRVSSYPLVRVQTNNRVVNLEKRGFLNVPGAALFFSLFNPNNYKKLYI